MLCGDNNDVISRNFQNTKKITWQQTHYTNLLYLPLSTELLIDFIQFFYSNI